VFVLGIRSEYGYGVQKDEVYESSRAKSLYQTDPRRRTWRSYL
jgi:hypothetical protein